MKVVITFLDGSARELHHTETIAFQDGYTLFLNGMKKPIAIVQSATVKEIHYPDNDTNLAIAL